MPRQYVYLHDYKCAFLFDNLNRTKFVIFCNQMYAKIFNLYYSFLFQVPFSFYEQSRYSYIYLKFKIKFLRKIINLFSDPLYGLEIWLNLKRIFNS